MVTTKDIVQILDDTLDTKIYVNEDSTLLPTIQNKKLCAEKILTLFKNS